MAENEEQTSVDEVKTKQSYRKIVWENLEKNNMVNFPRPVYGRIPNFKGCEEAASKLSLLEEFKSAQNIKVNPDKPQEPARFAVLENHKNLYVPIPKLANGLLKHITLAENHIKDDLRRAVSRRGIEESGKDVEIEDKLKIDLVVLGSVAVSKEGYRIGKGKGYADLEFAILSHMKAVNQNTTVITTVHDTQVFDKLPVDLFQAHDVPVDIIVTPTQVIHIEKRLPKPDGIIWKILSQRRIDMMPVLKALKEIDEKAEKDVTLKEVDSDVEIREPQRRFRKFYRFNRRRRYRSGDGKTSESQAEDGGEKNAQTRPIRRKFTRRRRAVSGDGNENGKTLPSEGENGDQSQRPRQKRNFRKNRPPIDFSLMVRNIERTVRVRDLKAALAERGVKPHIIIWRGFKGYCCLHFSKTNVNTEADHNVDNVIGMLQNLKVSPDAKKQLSVEVMRPISRIETTDVTAV